MGLMVNIAKTIRKLTILRHNICNFKLTFLFHQYSMRRLITNVVMCVSHFPSEKKTFITMVSNLNSIVLVWFCSSCNVSGGSGGPTQSILTFVIVLRKKAATEKKCNQRHGYIPSSDDNNSLLIIINFYSNKSWKSFSAVISRSATNSMIIMMANMFRITICSN